MSDDQNRSDDGACEPCSRGRCEHCSDDGAKNSPNACECARSTHGPNGIGVI